MSLTWPTRRPRGARNRPSACGPATSCSASWRPISGHDLYPLYLLAATTGMRRGELAGLTWRNVDLGAARLTVNQQILSVGLQSHRGQPQVRHEPAHHRPRSPHGRRVAPPPPETSSKQRMATGRRNDDGYVFAKPDGSPVPPGLHQPDLPARRRQARRAPHPPPRPAPHSRQHPAAARSQRQGSQRAPRPQQRRVHHDRLPTRHARHAGPSRSHLRCRRLRS